MIRPEQRVFLFMSPEETAAPLAIAEETLNMLDRGLTFAVDFTQKPLRMTNGNGIVVSNPPGLLVSRLECEPHRARSAFLTLFAASHEYESSAILRIFLNLVPKAIPFSRDDAALLSAQTRGLARIAALEMGANRAKLTLGYNDLTYVPFSLYLDGNSDPVDEEDLPKELTSLLCDPALPPMMICGKNSTSVPNLKMHPVSAVALPTDAMTAMHELQLAHDAIARGPTNFDPVRKS